MSCRRAATASTYGMGLSAMFAPNTVGGHSICPRCMEFNFNTRGGSKSRPTEGKAQNPNNGRGAPKTAEWLARYFVKHIQHSDNNRIVFAKF